MSAVTEARTALHEALVDTFVAPVGGLAFAGRVDRTQPSKLAAPRVWIGDSAGSRRQATAASYVVSFPVWVAFDGRDDRQVNGVEEVICRIHDTAVRAKHTVPGHVPALLPVELVDTAKPNVRASVVTVDVTVHSFTLCPPSDS